ncbi:F0F1 ATP synthase subunit B [Sinanaerobacter chloroacetimidivorans]|uniref:ATP synthase subunit b n=1 Tax=Sinanaerobacter chloroacetimidivorans TaxID=2818044 RepID=A0A8J8B4B7_9FIRM|nr:F0F1 ATP synthase subunit B [Sinanaerobacter chloroacetimidivorans]MBR0599185.1 F0F1 ATP synthase subunit B [Sinanaerobacter chloroacetimidivorans]
MEFYTGLIEFNWTLVMQWVTVLVLYLILKRFFFEKVHNFMQEREASVRDAFENADRVNLQAGEKLSAYQKQLSNIETEGREIIKNAKLKAEALAKDITDEANRKANEMILQAQREIERERIKAVAEMKEQIAGLAIYAAEKIIEKQLEQSGQEEIIQRIIEQAGRSEWQN